MTQITTKFIADNAVTDTKILLANSAYLRGRNAANTADISIFKVNASNRIEFASIPKYPVANPMPTLADEIVNKAYVDQQLLLKANQFWRDPVAVQDDTDASRPTGVSTIQSITINDADRVLFTNLSGGQAADNNKVFTATVSGGLITAWTVAADHAALGVPTEGDTVWVDTGTYADKQYTYNGTNWINSASGVSLVQGDMTTIDGSQRINVDLATVSGLQSTNPGNPAGQLQIKLESSNPTLQIDGSNQLGVKFSATGSGLKTTASGFSVAVDTSSDATTAINTSNSQLITPKERKTTLTLNGTDITNQYKDLTDLAQNNSVSLTVSAATQFLGVDYSLSTVGGVTRITFLGGLATAGASALVSGDVLYVEYRTYNT